MKTNFKITKQTFPKPVQGTFTPSPTRRIRFADGETVTLNRKQRRARKIYNKDLTPIKGGR